VNVVPSCVFEICFFILSLYYLETAFKKDKAVPLHATKALVGRGDIAPTHS
jgi:hypothetical protein